MTHPTVGKWSGSVDRRFDGIVGKHSYPYDGHTDIGLIEFFKNGCLYRPGTLSRSFRAHGRKDGQKPKLVLIGVEVLDQWVYRLG